MSREIRRVPLHFDAPLRKVWQGYITPEELRGRECTDCHGGEHWAARWLSTLCHRLMMLAQDAGREQPSGRLMHPWLAELPHPPIRWHELKPGAHRPFLSDAYDVMRPTEEIVELVMGLSGRRREDVLSMGSMAEHRMHSRLIELAGLDPETWWKCKSCDGHGEHERYPGQRAQREAWEWVQPPEGEGYQLWETTTEGSPVSPVQPDAEAMAAWLCTEEGRCAVGFGGHRIDWDIDGARRFVGIGYSIASMVVTSDGAVDGSVAAAQLDQPGGEQRRPQTSDVDAGPGTTWPPPDGAS